MRSTDPTDQPGRPASSRRCPTARPARGGRRGFTLIELLVALTAGLFVALAAFMLSRNTVNLFQREARLSAAQYGVMVGMSRLQADLQRASYLTLPNTGNPEYRLSGSKATWPAGMQRLAGITILQDASTDAVDATNGVAPDALILAGSFSSTERFGVRTIVPSGAGTQIYLQVDDAAMARALAAANNGAPGLDEIFAAGRIVRVQDDMGWSTYGVVASFDDSTANDVIVTLKGTPALAQRETEIHGGVHGLATSKYTINPVTRVRYDIRTVQGDSRYPQYQGLYTRANHQASAYHRGPAEPVRHELVRVELDETGAEVDGSLEILAEYAVDLEFGITVESDPPTIPATLTRYPFGDANVYTIANHIDAGGTPERIRSVQVRLSVRAAEADRQTDIVPAPLAGGLYRFDLGADPSGNPFGFARVRTLVSDVALPNNHYPE